MKKFYKHIGLFSIILLIVLSILHFFLKLIHVKFRKWVYVTVILISLIGIFIKILPILYSKIKKYKEDLFHIFLYSYRHINFIRNYILATSVINNFTYFINDRQFNRRYNSKL